MAESLDKKNSRLVKILILVAVVMFGFGYALVPLYDVLCEITGINGKTKELSAPEIPYQIATNREVVVELMTSVNEHTPLKFWAETKQVKVHPGEYQTVYFNAENQSAQSITTNAIPSFTPGLVVKYFYKVKCFCLDQQVFKPNEAKRMAMRFTIKPDLPNEIKTISLSYTFFDITKAATQ